MPKNKKNNEKILFKQYKKIYQHLINQVTFKEPKIPINLEETGTPDAWLKLIYETICHCYEDTDVAVKMIQYIRSAGIKTNDRDCDGLNLTFHACEAKNFQKKVIMYLAKAEPKSFFCMEASVKRIPLHDLCSQKIDVKSHHDLIICLHKTKILPQVINLNFNDYGNGILTPLHYMLESWVVTQGLLQLLLSYCKSNTLNPIQIFLNSDKCPIAPLESLRMNESIDKKVVHYLNHQLALSKNLVYCTLKVDRFSLFKQKQSLSGKVITDQGIIFNMGNAAENEDNFYDAVAQGLNRLFDAQIYTIKTLRLLCYETAIALDGRFDNQQSHPENWLGKLFKGQDQYDAYPVEALRTVKECQKMSASNEKMVAWRGQPHIDGRLICAAMNIKIYLLDLQSSNIGTRDTEIMKIPGSRKLITADGVKKVNNKVIDYNEKNLIHLALLNNCFIPLVHLNENQVFNFNIPTSK